MVDWILIIFILGSDAEVQLETVRFKGELSCLAAGKRIVETMKDVAQIRTLCAVDGEFKDVQNGVD